MLFDVGYYHLDRIMDYPSKSSWDNFSRASQFLNCLYRESASLPVSAEKSESDGIILKWAEGTVLFEYEINSQEGGNWTRKEERAIDSLTLTLMKTE